MHESLAVREIAQTGGFKCAQITYVLGIQCCDVGAVASFATQFLSKRPDTVEWIGKGADTADGAPAHDGLTKLGKANIVELLIAERRTSVATDALSGPDK